MGDVDVETAPFVVGVTADAAPTDSGIRWTRRLVAAAEAVARPRPGYGGVTWLARGRLLGPPRSTPDTERLMGLLFWRSSSDVEAFVAELGRTHAEAELIGELVVDDGVYQFSAAVTASSGDVTGVDTVRTGTGVVDEIIQMTTVSGKQAWVGEYNESETREHIKHLDGFVSASFFRDLRSDRIIEHVRWRSPADLTAAFGDARFSEHLSVNSHYSAWEARLFATQLVDGTA